MSLALIFPGQGSQYIGMGRALAETEPQAADVFARADEILGVDLTQMMLCGPEDELTATKNAQPAILTHSVAVLSAARARLGPVSLCAGHSVGEFSAHVAAGTLAFEDALTAVRLRGELMFEAGRERPGTMAAVLGLGDEEVEDVCDRVDAGTCVPASFNSHGQVVISGDVAGVEQGMELARNAGAKAVVPLKVSGAFHSPLMKRAADGLREHLESIEFRDPTFPVVSSVTAAPVPTVSDARDLLVKQVTSPVRWSASIGTMLAAGIDRFVEVGPGSTLCTMNRRNARGIPCTPLGESDDFASLEQPLGESNERT